MICNIGVGTAPAASTAAALAGAKPTQRPADKIASLVVVGHGSSDGTREWLKELGGRGVTQIDGTGRNDPMHRGTEEPPQDLLNTSPTPLATVDATTVAQHLEHTATPVLVSQRREAPSDVDGQLRETLNAVEATPPRAPVAVTPQADAFGGAKNGSHIVVKAWDSEQGLPLIGRDRPFMTAGSVSGDAADRQDADGTMTTTSHELWSQTVFNVVTGN